MKLCYKRSIKQTKINDKSLNVIKMTDVCNTLISQHLHSLLGQVAKQISVKMFHHLTSLEIFRQDFSIIYNSIYIICGAAEVTFSSFAALQFCFLVAIIRLQALHWWRTAWLVQWVTVQAIGVKFLIGKFALAMPTRVECFQFQVKRSRLCWHRVGISTELVVS